MRQAARVQAEVWACSTLLKIVPVTRQTLLMAIIMVGLVGVSGSYYSVTIYGKDRLIKEGLRQEGDGLLRQPY